ncbi:transposase [Rhodoferax sp.]|uniref:IS66-like element accessory protein TnpA n=1 Tax=Rhodoferax sp. TaxID=50421 RepID=UPI0025F09A7C|nr:transposase [Rhodoferax sp.]
MNTTLEQAVDGRGRRRIHSDEFKAAVVASCLQPGMSMAAVAMANGINANLLRRWVHAAEMRGDADQARALPAPKPTVRATAAGFVPVALPAPSQPPDIRIELRRGATAITVAWPTQAASECAAWMRELLR